jgi:hypothetical protein
VPSDDLYDLIDVGMEHRFTAAYGDDGGAERSKPVYAACDDIQWHRLGYLVILIAVSASKIATTHRY